MTLDFSAVLTRGGFLFQSGFSLDGELFGLAGHNGSGKSTLLHLLSGLLRPERGRIILNGRTLFDADRKLCLPPEKRRVGLVFQEGRLFPHLTVRRNLRYSPRSAHSDDPLFFAELAEALSLTDYLDARPGELSGGQRQRVALGRALLARPELLLLDEPFSAQDRIARNRLAGCLKEIHSRWRIPMILVSHQERDLSDLTEGILCLRNGTVVAGEVVR